MSDKLSMKDLRVPFVLLIVSFLITGNFLLAIANSIFGLFVYKKINDNIFDQPLAYGIGSTILAIPILAVPILVLPILAIPILVLPILAVPILAIPILVLPTLAIPTLEIPNFMVQKENSFSISE